MITGFISGSAAAAAAAAVLDDGVTLLVYSSESSDCPESTLPLTNDTSSLALSLSIPSAMLCLRFSRANLSARALISTPHICSFGNTGLRREWRRSGMQPVPVQRSTMRRVGRCSHLHSSLCARPFRLVGASFESNKLATRVVYDSVSGLFRGNQIDRKTTM